MLIMEQDYAKVRKQSFYGETQLFFNKIRKFCYIFFN